MDKILSPALINWRVGEQNIRKKRDSPAPEDMAALSVGHGPEWQNWRCKLEWSIINNPIAKKKRVICRPSGISLNSAPSGFLKIALILILCVSFQSISVTVMINTCCFEEKVTQSGQFAFQFYMQILSDKQTLHVYDVNFFCNALLRGTWLLFEPATFLDLSFITPPAMNYWLVTCTTL